MKNKLSALLLLLCLRAGAQTVINGGITVLGRADDSQATATLPDRQGTGSPVGRDNCTKVGESYFQTDATAGLEYVQGYRLGNPLYLVADPGWRWWGHRQRSLSRGSSVLGYTQSSVPQFLGWDGD